MKGGLDATGSLGKDKSNEGIDSTKFDVLYQLNPGSPLSNQSINVILRIAYNQLGRLNSDSKETFVKDVAHVIDYVLNEGKSEKERKKMKLPDAELIKWLNVIGPLTTLSETGVLNIPESDADKYSFSVDASEDGESETVYILPRLDVRS
jgi:hypothetical protein